MKRRTSIEVEEVYVEAIMRRYRLRTKTSARDGAPLLAADGDFARMDDAVALDLDEATPTS